MVLHFEKELPLVTDLKSLFLNDTPMLDVRAPVEFRQGAFIHAVNAPLINDEERHEIGKRYKQRGQDAAVKLGIELVSGDTRQRRIQQWQAFAGQHPQGVLYCFRGGMRSKISQQWIYDKTGIKYPRVQGGYKAMRRFLIDSSERLIKETDFIILSGITGSGKTRLLRDIGNAIDLEGLANHRGSAFGPTATPQPTQINFENALAVEQLKHEAAKHHTIVLEDEGKNIGSVHLPLELHQKMSESPIVLLEITLEQRIEISLIEYAKDSLENYQQVFGVEEGFRQFSAAFLRNIDKIQRRLGGERHQRLRKMIEIALEEHQRTGDYQAHRDWITILLTDYYDPMYQYQIRKKRERIVFTGDQQAVMEYLQENP